ncbi:MAG: ribonuclease D [Actinobacteria bacterium]|jgi:ribonuclease D|nr:MAG: ribonuclease D [Actinomycetota bacterium]
MGMIDFQYVGDTAALRDMLAHLRGSHISVDLESDSYHHYAEKIALLQICDGENIFVLDPFGVDLSLVAPLLRDRTMEKVFHDVDYDGRMLLTFLGVKPAPVFDTMVAARILGKEKVGLADLLSEYFDVELDKGFQKADWSRRPLGREMLEYAALDVAYLGQLRDRLAADIAAAGREDWAREEFGKLIANLEPMPAKKATFTRAKGARNLSPRQLAVLQKLLEWREGKAESMDVPTFKVIGTERLLHIAEKQPRSRRALEAMHVISERQAARFGSDIIRAVERGMKVPDAKLPRFPKSVQQKRDFAAEKILKEFKTARDGRAEELGLDPGFLLPNAVLKALARQKPADKREVKESGLLKEWQMQVMGDTLAACLRRK